MQRQHLNQTKNVIAPPQTQSHAIARSSTHPIEELQGAIGNQAVNKLLANQPIVQAKPMFKGLSGELRSPTPLQAKPAKEADRASVSKIQPENKTGLPDRLKAGIENYSGLAMDDVRVHYNSSKPSELQALAYTQGTDIHVAPGQEEHLPHEAWHFVQQMQGRVKPTIQTKGVGINDDPALEKEADVMGSKALQMESDKSTFEFLDNSPEAVAQTKIPDIQAGRVAAPQGKDISINADPKLEPEKDVLGAKATQGESVRVAVANRTVRGGTGNDPVQCVSWYEKFKKKFKKKKRKPDIGLKLSRPNTGSYDSENDDSKTEEEVKSPSLIESHRPTSSNPYDELPDYVKQSSRPTSSNPYDELPDYVKQSSRPISSNTHKALPAAEENKQVPDDVFDPSKENIPLRRENQLRSRGRIKYKGEASTLNEQQGQEFALGKEGYSSSDVSWRLLFLKDEYNSEDRLVRSLEHALDLLQKDKDNSIWAETPQMWQNRYKEIETEYIKSLNRLYAITKEIKQLKDLKAQNQE
jgi:Domain of unknown function (DUF4157)